MQIDADLEAAGQLHSRTQIPGILFTKPYIFGDFQTQNLRLGAVRLTDKTDKTQSLRFTLVDSKKTPASSVDADCTLSHHHQDEAPIGSISVASESEAFSCIFTFPLSLAVIPKPADTSIPPWTLKMNGPDGWLTRSADEYAVIAEHRTTTDQKHFSALGYSFRHKDQVAAEVVLATDPGFWLHKALLSQQRLLLAAASAAFLIRDDYDDTRFHPGRR